jgi:hypothetical protein
MPKKLAVGNRKPSVPRQPSTPKRELIALGRKRTAVRRAAKKV